MQMALTRGEHEKALIAPFQPRALKCIVTHAEKGAEGNQMHSVCHSFIYQDAPIRQTHHSLWNL